MHRKAKVRTNWDSNLAYVIGVITSDGNLSPDYRHIVITSKDIEMIDNCKLCLGIDNTIGTKSRGGSKVQKYFVLQFGDINFYNFLLSIGLSPKKSLILKDLKIPPTFYSDFLRGCIDGDGNISITSHPESQHKQIKVRLCSGSKQFLKWIHTQNKKYFKVKGGSISASKKSSAHTLLYGKADGKLLLEKLYYSESIALPRKKLLADIVLGKKLK